MGKTKRLTFEFVGRSYTMLCVSLRSLAVYLRPLVIYECWVLNVSS